MTSVGEGFYVFVHKDPSAVGSFRLIGICSEVANDTALACAVRMTEFNSMRCSKTGVQQVGVPEVCCLRGCNRRCLASSATFFQ